LTVLRDALTRAVSGAGGVLVIRGDPGIGKSTLIGAALDAVHVTGFVGHAVPGGPRPGRAVAEIAVAALAAGAGAGLDDPAVALFRRPLAALIGTTVADPGLVEDPAAFGPTPPPSGRGCSDCWVSRPIGRSPSSRTCSGRTRTPRPWWSSSPTTSTDGRPHW
jgi:hypothetical protein